jgi:hypothetical protein
MRLGAAATYVSAQVIVAALESADEGAALEEMSKYVGTDDLQLVADKSIALGADPATIGMFLDSLGNSEVIEVSGEAPVVTAIKRATRQWPWKWIAAGAGGIAVIALASHALKGRKGKKAASPAAAVAGIGRSIRRRLLWR